MYLVGLTGGIGSGKSETAHIFVELGIPVIDTDTIAHELTSAGHPILKRIIEQFGNGYLRQDQTLDRVALREKIFADQNARRQLEAILHPAIYEEVQQALRKNASAPYQVIAVPLLFESDRYLKLVNRSLVIDCNEELQVSRATARSSLTPSAVKAIMHAQMPRNERNSRADDVILNNGSLAELRKKIEAIHKNYMQACIVRD